MDPKLVEALGAYVPLAQTFLWVVLISSVGYALRVELRDLVVAVKKRVEGSGIVELGPLKLGPELRSLPQVDPTSGALAAKGREVNVEIPQNVSEWRQKRAEVYQRNRGVFLAHVLTPSEIAGQEFDIYIFLIKHQPNDPQHGSGGLAEVDHAEFYFGRQWQDKVFRETAQNGLVGLRTAAYGPFLCTCCVTFKDGYQTWLTRYIDFEMGRRLRVAS